MPFVPTHDLSGDRAADPAVQPDKPPVLRRATLRWLALSCLGLVLYGTLGPLGFRGGPWVAPAERWSWLPPALHSDRNDLLTNFLVYVPVGLAFRLLIRRRGRAGWGDLVLAFGLSVGLSYVTEVLQQFMPARSANLTDVGANAAGALVGCLLAPLVQSAIRRAHAALHELWRRRSWTVLAWGSGVVTALLMTIPWDLSAPHAEIMLWRPLDLPDVKRFGTFIALGFCVAAALIQRRGERRGTPQRVLLIVLPAAIVLELVQMVIGSRACGVLDALIATLGGMTGCGGAMMFSRLGLLNPDAEGGAHAQTQKSEDEAGRGRLGDLMRMVTVGALFATIVSAIVFGIDRKGPGAGAVPSPRVISVPFEAQFERPLHAAFAEMTEAITIYAFLTILCLALTRGRGGAAALLLAVGLVGLVEAGRLIWGGRDADLTQLLLAMLAWFVAMGAWRALQPHLGRQTPVTAAAA